MNSEENAISVATENSSKSDPMLDPKNGNIGNANPMHNMPNRNFMFLISKDLLGQSTIW